MLPEGKQTDPVPPVAIETELAESTCGTTQTNTQ